MWDALLKVAGNLFDFAKSSRKNAEDIKTLNKQVQEMSRMMEMLAIKLENYEKLGEKDREILLLQLKLILSSNGIKPSQIEEMDRALGEKEE